MNSLRNALLNYAEEAPSGVDLLARVRHLSRRRGRRRHAALAGVTVVLTAGAATTGAAVWPHGPAGQGPGSAGTAAAAPASLVAAPAVTLPTFPYTPGWAPAAAGEPAASFTTGGLLLSYPPDGPWPVVVLVQDHETTLPGQSLGPVTLTNGLVAQRHQVKAGLEAVTWRDGEHSVTVMGFDGATWADLLRFANQLRANPMTIRPPFRVDRIPDGSTLIAVRPDAMEYARPGLDVTITLAPAGPPPRALRIETFTDKQVVHVYFDGGKQAEITVAGSTPLSEIDLLSLAAGIHLT